MADRCGEGGEDTEGAAMTEEELDALVEERLKVWPEKFQKLPSVMEAFRGQMRRRILREQAAAETKEKQT